MSRINILGVVVAARDGGGGVGGSGGGGGGEDIGRCPSSLLFVS